MKRRHFSEERIIGLLKAAEAGAVGTELCRRHGATYYAWKAKHGGLEVSDAKRLRSLAEENARFKRLLADTMLDYAGLKDLLSKKMVAPGAKREAVAHLQATLGISERRACVVVRADRTSMRLALVNLEGVSIRCVSVIPSITRKDCRWRAKVVDQFTISLNSQWHFSRSLTSFLARCLRTRHSFVGLMEKGPPTFCHW